MGIGIGRLIVVLDCQMHAFLSHSDERRSIESFGRKTPQHNFVGHVAERHHWRRRERLGPSPFKVQSLQT